MNLTILMDILADFITGMVTGIIPIHQVVTIGFPHSIGIIDNERTSKPKIPSSKFNTMPQV